MKTQGVRRGGSRGGRTRLLRLIAVVLTMVLALSATARTADAQTSIIVNSLLDVVDGGDGRCTFREAIVAANTNTASGGVAGECPAGAPGLDAVTFSLAGTLTLASLELPQITESLKINGGGAVIVDAQDNSRIFNINTSGQVEVGDMELINGYSSGDGGAIRVESGSSFTLVSVSIRDSHADGAGGAVSVDTADLSLDDVKITDNSSDSGAGGISAIDTNVMISQSSLVGNSTAQAGRASALYAVDGPAAGYTTIVEDSIVSGNTTSAGNSPAIAVLNMSVTLRNVVVRDNTGVNLGALNLSRDWEIADSTISGNVGSLSATLSRTGSIVNTTISGNSGSVQLDGGSDADVFYSTITNNGGGLRIIGGAELMIGGSIVAGNTSHDVLAASTAVGSLTTEGHNVIGVLDDQSTGAILDFTGPLDMVGVLDPLLGPLAANGGSTQTHALLAGSPAIDRVLAALTHDPTEDQRGTARLAGAKDSGAFEAVGLAPVRCNTEVPTIDMNVNGGVGEGSAANDVIVGTAGDDTINGRAGADTICAGEGADTVRGGPGDDYIAGEGGVDELGGGGGADTIDGGADSDIIDGQGGPDMIDGGAGNDTINGRGAADTIDGGGGADTISGQNGGDTLIGSADNDHISGQTGPDTFLGGAGDDNLFGGNGADTLYGGPGIDKCAGNTGPDQAEAATCETTPGVETLF